MPSRTLLWMLLAIGLAACASPQSAPPAASIPSNPLPTLTPHEALPASPTPFTPELPQATSPAAVLALPDPAQASWQPVVSGLESPVDLQQAGDERLFVVEQPGRIRVVEQGQLLSEAFLDIAGRVGSQGNEQGLLGLAFHPRFSQNGHFYVNYTDLQGDTVIARFQTGTDLQHADPASEQILLTVDQPYANHNGGATAFGPDGYLYLGLGDGGSAGDPQGNAQSPWSLLGKVLRLDVDGVLPYAIPPGNPFVQQDGAPEVWALGLRNPWRFAFDRVTGDFYLGDVGQNTWEEIDFQPAAAGGGANYGWDLREGRHDYQGSFDPTLVEPIAEYSHDQGCSVTGGVVVRSPSLPAWQGVYLFGDYCSGKVWGLLREPTGAWRQALLYQTGSSITSFGEDSLGEVYLLDRGGTVYRLTPRP